MTYDWDFSVVWQYRGALLDGLLTTLRLTLYSAVFGLIFGILASVLLTARAGVARWPAVVVVELLRAIPLPVALIYLYYVAPVALGLNLPSFTTSVIVFGLSFGAFAGDVFRGSIQAIPRAHVDMAAAIGMSRISVFRRVIFTEVFRRSFPALNGMLVTLLKLTSLAAMINTPELVQSAGLVVSQRPRVFEVYTAMMVLYLAVVIPVVYLLRTLERSRAFALEPRGT